MPNNLAKKLKLNTESYISLILGLLVVVVIGVLAFNFFQAQKAEKPAKEGEVITGEEVTAEKEKEAKPTTYQVSSGDNLWKIAEDHFGSGYNWVDIAQANNLANPNYLEVGQELTIPEAEKKVPEPAITEETYTVVQGDNLWNIAVRAYGNGFAWTKIAEANNLTNPNLIHRGNVFTIPR